MTGLWLADDVRARWARCCCTPRPDPDKEALVFPDTRLTYRELADGAWQVAGFADRHGRARPASTSAS